MKKTIITMENKMQHKLMNIVLEAFKSGSMVSEEKINKYGSTIEQVLNVFEANQYVNVRVKERNGLKYVTGKLVENNRERYGLLPMTILNYNNETYMAENLPKHEGDL